MFITFLNVINIKVLFFHARNQTLSFALKQVTFHAYDIVSR